MLAQIKSSDEDVWSSLNRSGHIEGDPSDSLRVRLARMRMDRGAPLPEDAKLEIRSESEMMQGPRLVRMASPS